MNKISGSLAFDNNISTDVYRPAPGSAANVEFTPRGEAFSDGVEFSSQSRWGGGLDSFLDFTWGADKKLPEGGSSKTSCPKGTEPVVTTDENGTVHIKCEKPANPPPTIPILD